MLHKVEKQQMQDGCYHFRCLMYKSTIGVDSLPKTARAVATLRHEEAIIASSLYDR